MMSWSVWWSKTGELLHMLIWSVWWSIMVSYWICCVGLSGSVYWEVIAYVELFCLMVYNGEFLHMLSWSVWWSIIGRYCIC